MAGASDELRFLAAELHRAGSRDVLAELRDALQRAADPAADDARASILDMPAAGDARASILDVPATHEAGLRRGIADTVKVTATLGASIVRVRISATGPDRWPRAAAVTEAGKWNHPVFGDRERWVRQYGKQGWLEDAVFSHRDAFDRAVGDVTDRIERRLAGEA